MDSNNSLLFFLHDDSHLAKELSKALNMPLSPAKVSHFADGEVFAKPLVSVKEKECVVIQSTFRPANDRLMELLVFVDALKRAKAKKIHLVVPYYGYARQDRIIDEGDPISASLVAHLIEAAGASSIAFTDIHTIKILDFFKNIPATNIACMPLFAEYFKKQAYKCSFENKDIAIVSPDHGGVKRAEELLSFFEGSTLAIANKHRPRPNRAEIMGIKGDVADKLCIVIDDMIDTGGTVVAVTKCLYAKGAKGVLVGASHGIFSGNAVSNLLAANVNEIVVTDSIDLTKDGVSFISAAPLIAEYIKGLN